MVKQEAELCIPVYSRIRIYCYGKLLHTIAMDETDVSWLLSGFWKFVNYCDNKSAIDISKNPVQHSRTKHIDVRHHFIQELVEAKRIEIEHVATEAQLADLFTKANDFNRFVTLRNLIGVCELWLFQS